jgi:hypothetical protein
MAVYLLPDGALGPAEPADAEAIELDQLTRVIDVQASTRHTPLGDRLIPPHLGRTSSAAIRAGPKPGVAEGEGDHPLLDQHAGLIGHAWGTPLGGRRISGPYRSSWRFQR